METKVTDIKEKPLKEKLVEEKIIVVEVLKHKTKVGNFICAKGARMKVSESNAQTLEKLGLATIIGI